MTHEQLLRTYWAANPEMVATYEQYNGRIFMHNNKIYIRDPENFSLEDKGYFKCTNISSIKPHLKPLSAISDEDAVAVARMIYDFDKPDWKVIKRSDTYLALSSYRSDKWLEFNFNPVAVSIRDDNSDCTPSIFDPNIFRVFDYLRSKSYNLDFEPENFIEI